MRLSDEEIKPFLTSIEDIKELCFRWNGNVVNIDGILAAQEQATLKDVLFTLNETCPHNDKMLRKVKSDCPNCMNILKSALKQGRMPE